MALEDHSGLPCAALPGPPEQRAPPVPPGDLPDGAALQPASPSLPYAPRLPQFYFFPQFFLESPFRSRILTGDDIALE